jgi:flagellar basal-body rod protein FlgG
MSNAAAIALSGLKAEEHYINTLANDLANLNTPNYKTTTLTFSDMLYEKTALLPYKTQAGAGLGSQISQTGINFAKGPLTPSQNWNDIAIDGPGFFQVLNQEGTTFYTRNSNLTLDADRYLSTKDGFRLLDNIQIPEDAIKITIQKNGEVEATLPDESAPQLLGNIKLAKFVSGESLEPLGQGFYKTTEASGEPFIDSPGTSGLGELIQHQVEGSNVDMVSTLMQLTMAQRIYQLNAKAMQIADELEKITNELRA